MTTTPLSRSSATSPSAISAEQKKYGAERRGVLFVGTRFVPYFPGVIRNQMFERLLNLSNSLQYARE